MQGKGQEIAPENQIKQSKNKKKKIIYCVCIALAIVFSFCMGGLTYYLAQGEKARTVSWVVNNIDRNFLIFDESTGKVREFTAEDYADAIVNSLNDKYAKYYTSSQYSDVIATSEGRHYGTGLAFYANSNDTVVAGVTGNSPAYKQGIREGDIILGGRTSPEAQTVLFSDYESLSSFLTAREPGEEFELDYISSSNGYKSTATISKRAYVSNYVYYTDYQYQVEFLSLEDESKLLFSQTINGNPKLDKNSAIIKLEAFDGNAGEYFGKMMDYAKSVGKTKIILDLRDNGGGYMHELEKVASYLVCSNENNTLIAIAKDKNGNTKSFRTSGNNFNKDITKIVVIANENSASATECLIGAMLHYKNSFSQDNLIVVNDGDAKPCHTFGKGIMQTTYSNLFTGEAIKLTTAYVYQPDGNKCIHKTGIYAEIENSFNDDNLALEHAINLLKANN